MLFHRHAKEVRDMYEKKLATATELCEQLAVCKDILSQKEQKLEKSVNSIVFGITHYIQVSKKVV